MLRALIIVLLLAGIALTPATWHQPFELGWALALSVGVSYWQVCNSAAELLHAARLNMRWHNSPEQQRFDTIYGTGEQDKQ